MKNKILKSDQVIAPKRISALFMIWEALKPYRPILILSAIILIVVGLSMGGWVSYQNWQEGKAAHLFEIAKTEDDYKAIIQKYTQTETAALSMIYLGDLKLKADQYMEAKEIYEKFVRLYPKSLFSAFVKNLIGECYLKEKQYSRSEEVFASLLKDPHAFFMSSLVKINLGRVLAEKGNIEKSIEIFKELRKETDRGLWFDTLDAYIRRFEKVFISEHISKNSTENS